MRTGGMAVRAAYVLGGLVLVGSMAAVPASADTSAQALPFAQAWTNAGLITTDDIWSGVPGVIGYTGDDLTMVTGTDPQTIVADGSATLVDVIANQSNPNILTTGGVAEFAIANSVVAMQGAGTADAPQLVVAVNTTGIVNPAISYNLRDIDGSADNAVSPVALQFRVGASGPFTNLPAGFVADATGPNLATQVTAVAVTLPDVAEGQPLVQVRVMTTNAVGSDEWVGVDDIAVTGIVAPVSDPPADPPPDPLPAADTTPPETTLTKSPPKRIKRGRARFEFTPSEIGATFECALDRAAFATCASPVSLTVKRGKHSFSVRALDAAGNVDQTPATAKFKVKRKRRR